MNTLEQMETFCLSPVSVKQETGQEGVQLLPELVLMLTMELLQSLLNCTLQHRTCIQRHQLPVASIMLVHASVLISPQLVRKIV